MTYDSFDAELSRLMKTRSRLGSRAPGYAAIVFGLPFVESSRTDTMATDGKSVFFCREFVRQHTDAQLLAVLFHEGLHVTLGHHLRRGNIDPTTWNVAADYAINLIVQDAGLNLPDGALLDSQYRGLTAEQIARLLRQQQGNESGKGAAGSGDGEGEGDAPAGAPSGFPQAGEIWDAVSDDGSALSESERQEAEENLRRDVIVAAAAEKAAGSGTITLDGGVVEAAKAATVDWVEAMADFLNRAYAGEPTLAKPARRHLWEGNYFPSMQGVGGGDLVIAIDTSGSVSQDEAEQFASEIDAIREMVKPDRTCVIYCDSHIQKGRDGQSYDVFDSYEDIEVRAISGGGTRLDPPFHLVDQENLQPQALIYFTDGYATVEKRTASVVNYPVLWATTGVAPSFAGEEFGEVISLT